MELSWQRDWLGINTSHPKPSDLVSYFGRSKKKKNHKNNKTKNPLVFVWSGFGPPYSMWLLNGIRLFLNFYRLEGSLLIHTRCSFTRTSWSELAIRNRANFKWYHTKNILHIFGYSDLSSECPKTVCLKMSWLNFESIHTCRHYIRPFQTYLPNFVDFFCPVIFVECGSRQTIQKLYL